MGNQGFPPRNDRPHAGRSLVYNNAYFGYLYSPEGYSRRGVQKEPEPLATLGIGAGLFAGIENAIS